MGEACRNYIVALNEAGVKLTTELVPNLSSKIDLGYAFDVARELHGKDVNYKIKILHTTPDMVTRHMEPTKYHIFHLFWETSELPEWWVWALNLVDEIWTGSEWNKKIFHDSGVIKPIHVFPQAIDTGHTIPDKYTYIANTPRDQKFWFYSIFQWIERKDPRTLLEAYWREFEGDDSVGLILKTYKEKFTTEETRKIISQILDWKKQIGIKNFPEVIIIPRLMGREEIYKLHTSADCFVSAHRGEGWGIPIAEAMSMEKPVISTSLGGIHEYIPRNCAHLIPYTKTKVFNMDFVPWYDEKQLWAKADISELRKAMREVYLDRGASIKMGKMARQFVEQRFSYLTVGQQLKTRLKEIVNSNYKRRLVV